MICGRCKREIKVTESDSLLTFTNLVRMSTETVHLCERCSMGFIEWFSSGNYIQKQINAEEAKETNHV
jgi:hypothetical protein